MRGRRFMGLALLASVLFLAAPTTGWCGGADVIIAHKGGGGHKASVFSATVHGRGGWFSYILQILGR